MTVTTEVKKMGDALVAQGKATLADARRPLFAWIGVNRAVLARTRDLPEAVQAQVRQLPAKLGELPAAAKTLPRVIPADAVASSAKHLAVRAVELPLQAGAAAGTVASGVAERVALGYAGLVRRGEEVADTAAAQPAAEQAKKSAARAGRQTKAAATSARKAASAAATAARETAEETTS